MNGPRFGVAVLLAVWAPWVGAGLFTNHEQEAAGAFAEGRFDEAAAGFTDPYRKGVALYRAGDYGASADAFAAVTREEVRTDAAYNRGNALLRAGRLEAAVAAYEEALTRQPDHADAEHNLGLARVLLADAATAPAEQEEQVEEQETPPEEQQEEEQA
ncbi:MAG: tetratricopeptide repeat protein, partial [Gammaproteobacteria bacterium]